MAEGGRGIVKTNQSKFMIVAISSRLQQQQMRQKKNNKMFLQVLQTFPFVSIIFTSSNADPGQFLPNLTRMLSCESDARCKAKKKR